MFFDTKEAIMGGVGSGAKRSANVGNVEDMLAIDLRALRRLGVARAGECVIDTLHWCIDGLSVACVRLRVDLSDIERGGTMIVAGDMPEGTISQHIAIDAIPAPMGGHRCYFICPITGNRAEVIYFVNRRANGDRDRRAMGDRGLMRAYAVPEWRRA